MGIEELKKQEARRVRNEAEKCLCHASMVLAKTAHEIDGYVDQLKTACIPLRCQATLNEANFTLQLSSYLIWVLLNLQEHKRC